VGSHSELGSIEKGLLCFLEFVIVIFLRFNCDMDYLNLYRIGSYLLMLGFKYFVPRIGIVFGLIAILTGVANFLVTL